MAVFSCVYIYMYTYIHLPSILFSLFTKASKSFLSDCLWRRVCILLISFSITTLPVVPLICCCKSFLLTLSFSSSSTSSFSCSSNLCWQGRCSYMSYRCRKKHLLISCGAKQRKICNSVCCFWLVTKSLLYHQDYGVYSDAGTWSCSAWTNAQCQTLSISWLCVSKTSVTVRLWRSALRHNLTPAVQPCFTVLG